MNRPTEAVKPVMKEQAVPTAVSFNYRYVILGVCWLAYIVAFMMRLSIGPLAPFLKQDLSLTSAEVGLFVTASSFGYMLALLPAGWLVDRIGPRPVLLIGEVVGGVFLAGLFFIHSFVAGLVLMGLAGIGMGFLMPATTKGVIDWFPFNERATAMGFKQTAVNVGGIVAGATLPAIAIALSWNWGFLGLGIIAVLIGIVSFILYRQPPRAPVAAGTAPAVRSRKLDLSVFRARDIWAVMFAGALLNTVEFASASYFVSYLIDDLSFAPVAAGFAFAFCQGGGAVGKPGMGLVSDRFLGGSRKKAYLILAWICLFSTLGFALLPGTAGYWWVVALGVIFGFASVGWGGLHLTLVGEFASKETVGTVTGLATILVMAGAMVGPPVFGRIVDATASYQVAWGFLVLLSVLATGVIFVIREKKPGDSLV